LNQFPAAGALESDLQSHMAHYTGTSKRTVGERRFLTELSQQLGGRLCDENDIFVGIHRALDAVRIVRFGFGFDDNIANSILDSISDAAIQSNVANMLSHYF